MKQSDHIIKKLMDSNQEFVRELKKFFRQNEIDIKKFSQESGVPINTLYKITSNEKKDFRISTLRAIYKTIHSYEYDEPFIALVTNRAVLDEMRVSSYGRGKNEVKIKEHPANTMEEVIGSAVKAEKDGAKGVVCGPIASRILENILSIPISSIKMEQKGIVSAIDTLSKKIR